MLHEVFGIYNFTRHQGGPMIGLGGAPIGYARFDHAHHRLVAKRIAPNERHQSLFQLFTQTVMHEAFPCIGAQKVMRDSCIAFCLSNAPFNTPAGASVAVQYLYQCIADAKYDEMKRSRTATAFSTCIIAFPEDPKEKKLADEAEAERQLWKFLGLIHQSDKRYHLWSRECEPFVYDKRFSMSIGRHAHFVAFFSPAAITPSRRFLQPMLVFNPHFLFERMRERGMFDGWRDVIRKRASGAQDGWINPKLADFGKEWEAPQYALTLHPKFDIGPCPFTGRPRPQNVPDYDMSGHPFRPVAAEA